MTSRYATTAAFHTAAETRFRSAAKASGRTVSQVRRQYLTQRFLARVFSNDQRDWILLGGSALLARVPSARHSRDVDFIYPANLTSAARDLTQLVAAEPFPDPFAFDIAATGPARDDHVSVKLTARLGVTTVDTFTVDITRRIPFGEMDVVRPEPVIVIDDVDDLPPFVTVSLAQQVSDKLSAMYEVHGRRDGNAIPSSRYRDLVDLTLIITKFELAAVDLVASLDHEQRRRNLVIPHALPSPGRQWAAGYKRLAHGVVPVGLDELESAMERLRRFAGPLLDRSAAGHWDTTEFRWSEADVVRPLLSV